MLTATMVTSMTVMLMKLKIDVFIMAMEVRMPLLTDGAAAIIR